MAEEGPALNAQHRNSTQVTAILLVFQRGEVELLHDTRNRNWHDPGVLLGKACPSLKRGLKNADRNSISNSERDMVLCAAQG